MFRMMIRSFVLAALITAVQLLPTMAAVDSGVCTAADQVGCTGTNLRVNANEELAALNARAPLLLSSVAGSNAITACTSPAITSYADGRLFHLKPAAANTTAATINLCAVGVIALTAADGTALAGNELDPAAIYLLRYVAGSAHMRVLGPVVQDRYIRTNAAYTLSNVATEQKIFNASTNGTLTVPVGTYEFRCLLQVTAMSATSGNAAFDLQGVGTATLANVAYSVTGFDGAAATPVAPSYMIVLAAQTPTPMVTATTATELNAVIEGIFVVTAAGTVQPAITLANASAAIVSARSYCRVTRLSPAVTATIGPWN